MNIIVLSGNQADITNLGFHIGAIVNAANIFLAGGGGVDGMIHAAAGIELYKACAKIIDNLKDCTAETGRAYVTPAFNLNADYIIHTPGPIWNGGIENEDKDLKASYENSLKAAEELGCESIAFPCISTGIYGFPKERAAKIVSSLLSSFSSKCIKNVYICAFDAEDADFYNTFLNQEK